MRLLFAITVLSFCAVLRIALALARRIRRSQVTPLRVERRAANTQLETRTSAGQEFFEAGEFRTPRPLRLDQEILQQRPRRPLAEISFASDKTEVATSNHHHSPPGPAYASLFGRTVPIDRISQPLSSGVDASINTTEMLPAVPVAAPVPITLHRKPPQAARMSGLRRRVDLSQYTKDMGDLTDPYTNPLRGSGTQGPVPVDRMRRR